MTRSWLRGLSALALISGVASAAAACSVQSTPEEEVTAAKSDAVIFTQKITADGKGNFYLVTAAGDLLWYRDGGQNGTWSWTRGSGNKIGKGWDVNVVDIAAGGNGVLYVLKTNGDLVWYRDEPQDGNVAWTPSSGAVIRTGLAHITKLISGGDGVLYMLRDDGDLLFYRDLARDGRSLWASESGNRVGNGWGGLQQIFTCNDNIVYAVDGTGNLRWYRDNARNGTYGWDARSGNVIGTGWGGLKHLFCAGAGNIYAVNSTGSLKWYKDLARNGTWGWAPGSGAQIGVGWSNVVGPSGTFRSCSVNTDCPDHQECRSGVCRVMASQSWCDGPSTGRDTRGDHVDCGGYACKSGLCRDKCVDASDCAAYHVCNTETGRCQKVVGEDDIRNGSSEFELASTPPYRETIMVPGCATDADCTAPDTCVRGACMRIGLRCSEDRKSSLYWGSPMSCGLFACEPLRGSCYLSCFDSNACSDSICNPESRQCVR